MDDRIRIGTDPTPPERSHRDDHYEAPEVIDYGTLQELTLSGSMPLSDSFGGSSGGGS